MVLAIEEARPRRHEAIRPEHLLMGLLRDGGRLIGDALRQRLHVSAEALRSEVERVLAEVKTTGLASELSFSHELKGVLETAIEEQRSCRRRLIGTEHILIALMRDPQTVRVLRDAGADPEEALRPTLLFSWDKTRLIATSKWRVQI